MDHDDEYELLDAIADPLIAAGMRLATPEETQAIVDQAVAHVREQEELIARTPLAHTVEGLPDLPTPGSDISVTLMRMVQDITQMVRDVTNPAVAYGPNRDGYGKCVEAMWRAGYLAMQTVARELGVTGFQHSAAAMELFAKLRGCEGPFLVVELERALYPTTDLHARLDEALEEVRPWLAEQAAQKLADGVDAHPDVIAHWRKLAAGGES